MSTVLTKPVLLDETGQSIVNKLDDIKLAIGGAGEFIPINIRVTTPTTKTTYYAGDTLDLSGMVVTLYGSNGGMYDITGDCVFSPANGAILTTANTSVSISYTWYKDSTVFTASQDIVVNNAIPISIGVTTAPTKTSYMVGESLDLTGLEVTALYTDRTTVDVTTSCVFNPADGTILNSENIDSVAISYTENGITVTTTLAITVDAILVPWSTATDEKINRMVQAYYDGQITLSDVQSVWSIGDIRTMTINAIETTGTYNDNTWSVGESHRSQEVEVEILDFDHDTLTIPLGGKTKALITVDIKNLLKSEGIEDGQGNLNTELGYMNATNNSTKGWSQSARRKWCNGGFYQSIPSNMRGLIKAVEKSTNARPSYGTDSIDTDSDYVFLPSEIEVFGVLNKSMAGEGNQYAWFANATANRYKGPVSGTNPNMSWYTRSPVTGYNHGFCGEGNNGSSTSFSADMAIGIAPAWSI